MKLQFKTKESQMHKYAYNIVRDDHPESLVLKSQDLKRMQATFETSKLRRAKYIKMTPTDPVQQLNPFQKALGEMLLDATEAIQSHTKIVFCSIQKKEN